MMMLQSTKDPGTAAFNGKQCALARRCQARPRGESDCCRIEYRMFLHVCSYRGAEVFSSVGTRAWAQRVIADLFGRHTGDFEKIRGGRGCSVHLISSRSHIKVCVSR